MEGSVVDVLILLVIIAVVALFAVYFFRPNRSTPLFRKKSKDLVPSTACAKPLAAMRRLARAQQFSVIAPAHLAQKGVFADYDAILVGCAGLLCVKCVGLGGELYGTGDDAKWVQIVDGERRPFANPVREAEDGTRVVREALFAAKLKNIPVEAVCVFTNPKATVAVPLSAGYYTVQYFSKLLRKDRFVADKKVNIEAAVNALGACIVSQDVAVK